MRMKDKQIVLPTGKLIYNYIMFLDGILLLPVS